MPLPSGGEDSVSFVCAGSNNATLVTSTKSRMVFTLACYSILGPPAFLKLYNKSSAPSPAADAALLVARFAIPGNAGGANFGSGFNLSFPNGMRGFSEGIGFAVVTGIGDTDNTAVAAASVIVNLTWGGAGG